MLQNDAEPSTLFITANQRLVTYLRQQHDAAQQAAGYKTWPTLACLSLKHWLIQCYESLPNTHLVLQESQELALWEKIITAATQDLPLLRPRATAQIAADAWHLLRQWQIPLATLLTNDSIDVQAFSRWAQSYQVSCQKQRWADLSDCVKTLIERKAELSLLPASITLVGFQEISPLIQTFFKLLGEKIPINFAELPQKNISCRRFACVDEETEIRAMANWANTTWKNNPDYKICCVVPKLNTLRAPIERIFAEVSETPLPLNISGGNPLSSFPLIHTALQILRINPHKISLEQLSQFLRSPFFGGAEQEMSQRAVADVALRKMNERFFSFNHIIRTTQLATFCPKFALQLQEYAQYKTPAKQLPSAWAKTFSAQLNIIGWPGERLLNSAEYQQLQRWHSLLQEFACLDLIYEQPIDRYTAIEQLQNITQKIIFQPQNTETSIQVLGLLEAVGMQFDGLWIMGMNEDQWPQSPSPNPFIPQILQRQHQMPHASAEREFEFSKRLTKLFSHSAQQVMFSYSLKNNDVDLYPSPLILQFPILEELDYEISAPKKSIDPEWEYLHDDRAPALALDENPKGGASIIKHQAACPFRAFAKSRLHAESLPTISSGFSAQERGNYLHAILEQLWRNLGDQFTLNNLPDEQLDNLLESIIEQLLTTKMQQRPHGLQPNLCAIEKKRLKERTKSWLQLEKDRPPFRVINQETLSNVEFAGLRLQLRIDREDELENGDRIIIDYKTGQAHVADWFGERPNDPQLPLYLVTHPYPISALAFAQLHISKSEFKGISASDTNISGIKPIAKQTHTETILSWDTFQQIQNDTLSKLALNFQAGHATVDPKDAATCNYCDLHALCRVMNQY